MTTLPASLELFYSYADPDENLCTELDRHLSQLRRDGFIVALHKHQIPAGQDRAKVLDQHLNTASIILLLVSSDFLASDYCYSTEIQRAMERNAAGEARVLPLLLRPCDWQHAPFAHLQALPSNGVPLTLWDNRDAAFADVVQGIRATLQDVQHLGVSTSPPAFPHIWNIPYPRNPVFTGREDILKQLSESLKTGQRILAICGLGGVGKTQVAIEYAYRHRDEYRALLWVRADSHKSLILDFVALARQLHLPEKDNQDQTIVVEAVKQWMDRQSQWLLILDNAEDILMTTRFLPLAGKGHILLTTQALAQGPLVQSIEVSHMGLTEGTVFLLRRAKRLRSEASLNQVPPAEHSASEEIVRLLGGLPLALDQAGAYIEETGCRVSDYVDRYHAQRKKLLQRRGRFALDHLAPVTTTFLLAFDKIERINPASTQILQLCAFLHPDSIPEEIITSGAPDLGPDLQALAEDPIALDEAMEALLAYALLRRIPETKVLSIHRLVQQILKDAMERNQQHQWAERVVRAVNRVFPDPEDVATWSICRQYLLHAQACEALIRQWNLSFSEATVLLNQIGYYLQHAHAQYTEAESLYRLSLGIDTETFGSDHSKLIPSLNNLAEIYRIQGRYIEAKPLYEQALALRIQQFGFNHPSVANGLNNLAMFYGDQGDYTQAEQFHLQALTIRRHLLGPEHRDIIGSLNNLADTYRVQAKYDQAEALYQEALAMSKQVLGEDHPDVATILNNLAVFYCMQNNYDKAQQFCTQSLSITEQTLGPHHADTAITLLGLADVRIHYGEYDQAEELIQRALLIFERTLGTKHFYRALCLNNLGWLYYVQGKHAQAELFYQEALALYEKYPELKHPHLVEVLRKLADLYQALKKWGEAETCYEQALMLREQALGPEHPRVANDYHNLGWLYHQQKKYDKAKQFYQHALSIKEELPGSEDPDRGIFLSNLAKLYMDQRRYATAEPLYEQALAIHKQMLGPEHPKTVHSMNSLALLHYKQGKYDEAEPLYQRAIDIGERVWGSDHSKTVTILSNLALLYDAQGKYEEAELLYQQVLESRRRILGPAHATVAQVLKNYVVLLRKMGREGEATDLEAGTKVTYG